MTPQLIDLSIHCVIGSLMNEPAKLMAATSRDVQRSSAMR
jgi:hypothetical protein